MVQVRKFIRDNLDFIVIWTLASVVFASIAFPSCADHQPRHFIISDRPMSDGYIEVNVENVRVDVLLKGLWEESPELSRGVLVSGGRRPPLISVRYAGSLRDLDTAIDAYLRSVGWTRYRTLRGVDVLAPARGGGSGGTRPPTGRAASPLTPTPPASAGVSGSVEPPTPSP